LSQVSKLLFDFEFMFLIAGSRKSSRNISSKRKRSRE